MKEHYEFEEYQVYQEFGRSLRLSKRILMHICCAPCSVYPIKKLREQGYDIHGFFFNPNIHPFKEYESRMNALKEFAGKIELPVEYHGGYGLKEYLRNVVNREDDRCIYCYTVRLDRAAKEAKEKGFEAFTTSLLASPWQKHELIREMGEKAAKRYGVEFLYRDFRQGFREGQNEAREIGLYMQKYCGCIYSEEERYKRNNI